MQLKSAGQPFRPSAGEANEVARAVDFVNHLRNTYGAGKDGANENSPLARVENSTGAALDFASIVWLEDTAIGPDEDRDEFSLRITMLASVPSAQTLGRVGVLIEPANPGQVTRAVVAGLAACKLKLTDATLNRATEIVGETGMLVTAPHGHIDVLWHEEIEEGDDPDPVKWALVRLGAATYVEFDARVTASSLFTDEEDPKPSWDYMIKRGLWVPASRKVVLADAAPALIAFNTLEDPDNYQAGQSLVPAGSKLTPGAVEGPVVARFSGTYDETGDPIYLFTQGNPMTVSCP